MKNFVLGFLVAAVIALLVIIFSPDIFNFTAEAPSTGDEITQDNDEDKDEEESKEEDEVEIAPNQTTLGDMSDIYIGKKIGAMTVSEIDTFTVTLTGETEISGEYHYIPNGDGIIQDTVCFTPDEESKAKLPNGYYFCINSSKAKSEFAPEGSKGKTTIIIDNFRFINAGTDGWPEADLVEVIEKN